jgi:molybdate transport system substrate-binding protein
MPSLKPSKSRRRLILLATYLTAVAACAPGSGEPPGTSRPAELLVSAAASLADVFAGIGSAFEEANPGVRVQLNLGSSAALRQQVLEGAPVDVFATADTFNMDQVVEQSEVATEPEIFARNLMEIAVPAGNPALITGLDDFSDEDLLIGLCVETAPCGVFAREVLENAGVVASIDSNEPDVRALLTKIGGGDLDAGIVYVTDILSSSEVEGLEIPPDVNVSTDYPIAVLADGPNTATAGLFVEFVLSEQGRAILDGYGFSSP